MKRKEINEMHALHQQHKKRLESMQATIAKESRRIQAWSQACVKNFTVELNNMMNELKEVHSSNIMKALSKERE